MRSIIIGSLAFALAACTAETPEEGIESDTASLEKGCIDKIAAKVGTPEWKAAVEACVADAKKGGGAAGQPGESKPGAPGKPGQAQQGSSSSANGCSVSVQCNDGGCQCGAGPKKGVACDGKSTTGPNSCSVVCKYGC